MILKAPPDCLLFKPTFAQHMLLDSCIKDASLFGYWVEIGMFRGGSLVLWKQCIDALRESNIYANPTMVGVDPYIPGTFSPGEDVEAFMRIAESRLMQFQKWEFFRMQGEEWLKINAQEAPYFGMISFCLLDGTHVTEKVEDELKLLIPAMSKTSLLIIDDTHSEPDFPDREKRLSELVASLAKDSVCKKLRTTELPPIYPKEITYHEQIYVFNGFDPDPKLLEKMIPIDD